MIMSRPVPRPGVLDIDAYVPGKAGAPGAGRVFKLSANESPLGPSPRAVQALRDMAHEIAIYPEGSSHKLRETVGAVNGLDPARIIMGAGSDNILELLALAYLAPGDEAIYTQYGFLEYRIVTLAAGGVPVVAPETHYTADVDAILERVTARTRIVFLANPNNPTGSYLPRGEIERLANSLPPHVLLVLDAAYAEYVVNDDYESGVALATSRDNVVMTRTFSKIYGLAGLRLGWGYGPSHVIDALNRIRSPFNVSTAASAAGIASAQDVAHMQAAVAHNAKWLPWLTREIEALGLEVLPSVANFVAIRFPTQPGRAAADADRFLTSRGLVLRAIGAYGMGEFLRLTVGLDEANVAVVAALADFMEDRKAAANG
ncbi:histidinol-phosphate aminotransferase [Methylocystis echinoides]|uniref:Histidinol-phosphate aminotransferase n=2 Tax=Methylocystis echinoides TaxID=29468 RepID=A0A9W6LR86_9HYPH|nr:histidinol-phosphate aminotransferase [Methylocystis echinoides]